MHISKVTTIQMNAKAVFNFLKILWLLLGFDQYETAPNASFSIWLQNSALDPVLAICCGNTFN